MSISTLRRRVGRAAIAPVVLIGCASALAAQRQVAKSHATSVADSLNLRKADLSGFKQIGHEGPPAAPARKLDAEFAACYHGPPYSDVYADVQSPAFQAATPSTTFVVTETEIFPTAALASRDIAAASGARGRACALSFGRATVTAQKGTKILATLTPIASRVSGTGAVIAVRLTLTQAPTSHGGPAKKVIGTQDEFNFVRGQAEIGLDIATNSAAAPSASLERRLASLVSARARSVMG
jgi:hypothetical protein